MNPLFCCRGVYLEAQSIAEHSKGGWAIQYKGIKPRTKWFKKYMCGHMLKADLNSLILN